MFTSAEALGLVRAADNIIQRRAREMLFLNFHKSGYRCNQVIISTALIVQSDSAAWIYYRNAILGRKHILTAPEQILPARD